MMTEMISDACHVIVPMLWCFYWRDFSRNFND